MSIAAMNWVWEHSPTSGNERLVLLAIADCSDDSGGNAWPSVGKLAAKARLDPRTVQRVIGRLEADGHLIVERGAGRKGTNVYHVVIHTPQQDPRQTATPAERQGEATAPGGGVAQLCRGEGGTAMPPERPVPPVPPPPARASGKAPPVDNPGPGGGATLDPDWQEAATSRFFERLGPGWPLSRSQRRRLRPAVSAALTGGWPADALAGYVGANTDGIRNAYAVLTARLSDLPDPPAAAPARPAWCGTCNPDTRRIEALDGEDAGRCPTCHPLTATHTRLKGVPS